MANFLSAIAPILIIVFFVMVAAEAKRRRRVVEVGRPQYFGKKPLTVSEQKFYARLREAMPECVVLAQVALSSLIETKEEGRVRPWFNRISQKSVDYVLCLPNDFTVVAVIELDDMSHTRSDRVRADNAKDTALRIAGHPILRFKTHQMPSVEQIRAAITGKESATA